MNDGFSADIENVVGFNGINNEDFFDTGSSCDGIDAAVTMTEQAKDDTAFTTTFNCCFRDITRIYHLRNSVGTSRAESNNTCEKATKNRFLRKFSPKND